MLRNGWKKVKKILKGGKERYDSSLSAIRAYSGRDVNLVFHDAVRPLVSQRIIDDVCEALQTYEAIDVTLPAVDTIIEAEGDHIAAIPDRSRLQRGQTPQAFRRDVIERAYDRALQDPNFKVTDDCGVVVKYLPEVPVHLVAGEESNMKLTYKEDTYLLDKFFQLRKSELPEQTEGTQETLKGKVAVVFGGSYGIGLDTANQLREAGAHVHSFSRGTTHTDVGNLDDVVKALSEVAQKEGRIDFVVNTAGILNKEPLCTMKYETIQKAVTTNYMGTVNVAISAIPTSRRHTANWCSSPQVATREAALSIVSIRRPKRPSSISCKPLPRNGNRRASLSTASTRNVQKRPCACKTSAWSPTTRSCALKTWRLPRYAPCCRTIRGRSLT